MSAFPNWKNFVVVQRRPATGCIPTGYEMILRSCGAEGINFESFQDDFDLDINLGNGQSEPRNNFGSVASEIQKKYGWLKFDQKSFSSGLEKVAFIDTKLASQQPVLVSVSLEAAGSAGWHIMPIVDSTEDQYLFLKYVDPDGKMQIEWVDKTVLAQIHDNFSGGKEVAFLSEIGQPTAPHSQDK